MSRGCSIMDNNVYIPSTLTDVRVCDLVGEDGDW